MHCPSCGNESSLDQKFCRKCGFGLEAISKLVGQNRSEDRLEIDKAERERLIVRHMFRWLALGLLVIGLAVLMLVTNKNFDIGKFFGWAASLVLLIGTGMATYGVISAIGKGTS
ncbi:MAG TPA: zinc-ribbon domain-containing protein, partial [Pyrinomonadaceae bacterium]|nr:zinc-ribbon domain-containing protein [Pyrinomonadaceae bacterium]